MTDNKSDDISLPNGVNLPFEAYSHTITPFFKHMSILSVPDSETKGEAVYDLKEMVELRFAGDRNYAPVFEAGEMWRNYKGRIITYAERFADQYRAFVLGENQTAGGTALEMLKPYGMTPQQISLCNALKVYSIEAILEMKNANALGMSTNAIREMAKRWEEDHQRKFEAKAGEDISAMQAEIARLTALIPASQAAPEVIDALVAAADAGESVANDRYATMDDAALKAEIKERTGAAPRGQPSRDFLLNALRELDAA